MIATPKFADTPRMSYSLSSASDRFPDMSTRTRTPRGTGMDRVQVGFRVSGSAKTKLNHMADCVGLSQSQVLELLLEHVDVDSDGTVWVGDAILSHDSQEALPLASTA